MEDVKPSSGEGESNIKSKTDVALLWHCDCATLSGRVGMDRSPFSGANKKIEKIQLCSLCVLVQSESRAIEQLSYILETREERTFDNIFDVKIFSFQFDQYPLAEQFVPVLLV